MALEAKEMSFQDKMEAFGRSALFSMMSKEVLPVLASIAVTVRFRKGDFIFREQDKCSFFYLVKEGRVKDFKQSAGGRQIVVHVAGPGDSLNAVVLFSGNPHFVSAQAMDDSVLLRMRKEDIQPILRKDRDNLVQVILLMERALSSSYDRLIELVGEKAEQRIYNVLYMLNQKFGEVLRFTGEEIGELSGTTTETAVRTLMRLKQLRMIDSSRREIRILDCDELRNLSHCLGYLPGRI